MATDNALLIEAAVFTLGCACIHTLRHQARLVTMMLSGTAVMLFLLLVVCGVAVESEHEARQGVAIFDSSAPAAEH